LDDGVFEGDLDSGDDYMPSVEKNKEAGDFESNVLTKAVDPMLAIWRTVGHKAFVD
jgi:hypothetical protein